MKTAARLLLIALVAVVAVSLWGVLFPNPEKIIRKRLQETARAASFGPGESYLSRLAGAQRLADFCVTNVDVVVELPGHQQRQWAGREEIQQAALAARATLESVKVTFPEISVTVGPDKQSAVADLAAEAQIAGDPNLLVQELKITWRKIGGQWLITQVQTVQTLQTPDKP